jgi:hypothetical protein
LRGVIAKYVHDLDKDRHGDFRLPWSRGKIIKTDQMQIFLSQGLGPFLGRDFLIFAALQFDFLNLLDQPGNIFISGELFINNRRREPCY